MHVSSAKTQMIFSYKGAQAARPGTIKTISQFDIMNNVLPGEEYYNENDDKCIVIAIVV